MKSFTVDSFWVSFNKLPDAIQNISRNKFELWKKNPFHPSLQFKCVNSPNDIWSVRITLNHRALGVIEGKDIIWYWIGTHTEYEKLLKK